MKILFMGDSITDCGRNMLNGSQLDIGQGYPMLISAELGADNPLKYAFVNTGVSGNRIVDMYARIKCDVWNHNPDIFSILVGINDVWHDVLFNNGVDAERFEKVLDMYVSDTLNRFPDMKMLLLEPFVLKACATEEHWTLFESETAKRSASVKKIAEKYGQKFVPLQNMFDKACEKAPASYWLADGVHPTPAGHMLIAREWLKAFNEINK